MDYYEILGVPRDASAAEIERGFRSVARRVHPDLNLGDGNADARMKQLNHIRDTLADPLLRAAYDDRLRQEGAAPPGARPGRAGDGAESANRPAASRFGAARTAPGRAWRAPDSPGREGGPGAEPRAPNTAAAVPTGRRWLAALILVLLPATGVLVIRSARGRYADSSLATATTPTTTPTPTATVTATGPTPRPPAMPANEPPHATAGSPRRSAPAALESTARAGGVVRIGSTLDQIRGAFGPPDRIEPGARPGDATLIYGALRLDLHNGRVVAGAAPAGPRGPAASARRR